MAPPPHSTGGTITKSLSLLTVSCGTIGIER